MAFSIDGGFLSHGGIETTMVTTEDPPWLKNTPLYAQKNTSIRYMVYPVIIPNPTWETNVS